MNVEIDSQTTIAGSGRFTKDYFVPTACNARLLVHEMFPNVRPSTSRAETTVTFVSPCECIAFHGMNRWIAIRAKMGSLARTIRPASPAFRIKLEFYYVVLVGA